MSEYFVETKADQDKPPQVVVQLSDMTAYADEIMRICADLEKRFAAVTLSRNSVEKEIPSVVVPELVPLAQIMRDNNRKLFAAMILLNDILARCQL